MQYELLVAACWVVFIVYWGISAMSAKRTLNRPYGISMWWRLPAIVLILLFFKFAGFRTSASIHPSEIVGLLGVILCAIGIGIAIWARLHLASNWGMPMSVKESPELVTTGPYTYIRHPIYTGILLAMLGSALVSGPLWGIIMLVAGAYFIYSATQEEKLMLSEFPEEYPAYKARTKMLIPFIF
jgi:protein-S-isoprenylcysteine O-methyltransferase Ste14